jgi:cytochrome P450
MAFRLGRIEMTDQDDFDLTAVEDGFYQNPYPVYRALRDRAEPTRQPDGSYFVGRYQDVSAILSDDANFSSDKKIDFKPKFGDGPLYEHHTTSLVFNDPPYHTRVRRLLTPFFTPRTLRAVEPGLDAMVDELLDRAQAAGSFDMVKDFAIAIPLTLIGDLLGVPRDEREPLRNWANVILGALEPALSPEQLAIGNKAVEDFKEYLRELIVWKRGRLKQREESDVLSALLADHDTADGLTEIELMHNCIFLLNAGHDTTATLISNGMDLLFRYPDQMARLRVEPDLMKPAIEEMLRFESPLQIGNRRATNEVTVQGRRFPKGTFFHVGIGAANHDERQFDDPETLDFARRPNRHLAFGNGIHTCAGNSLSRMEATLAFSKLLRRFPTIEQTGPTVRPPRARFRIISEMPVRVAA